MIDLLETNRNIVRKYFPNAKVVADRFHVIQLVNQHFLYLWNLNQEQRDNLARQPPLSGELSALLISITNQYG